VLEKEKPERLLRHATKVRADVPTKNAISKTKV